MNITTITVKRTLQVKQYEPITLELTAEVQHDEDALDCVNELLTLVEDMLNAKVAYLRGQTLTPPKF